MTTIQFILLILVAAIAGMGSVLDEAQFHRPLVACTLVGLVLGDVTTGIILGGTLEMLALGWMNPLVIILGLFALGIIGYAIGLFA